MAVLLECIEACGVSIGVMFGFALFETREAGLSAASKAGKLEEEEEEEKEAGAAPTGIWDWHKNGKLALMRRGCTRICIDRGRLAFITWAAGPRWLALRSLVSVMILVGLCRWIIQPAGSTMEHLDASFCGDVDLPQIVASARRRWFLRPPSARWRQLATIRWRSVFA